MQRGREDDPLHRRTTALMVPYNFKLLLQEMASCGISWQFEMR